MSRVVCVHAVWCVCHVCVHVFACTICVCACGMCVHVGCGMCACGMCACGMCVHVGCVCVMFIYFNSTSVDEHHILA